MKEKLLAPVVLHVGTYDLVRKTKLATMKLSKKVIMPALLLGVITVGGATAYAAGPGMDVAALTGFSDAQKTAITEAFQIRKDAGTQAKAVLEAAGVDQTKLRDAMHAQHEGNRAKFDAALDANDYAAFTALVAGTPRADTITPEVFASLVQVRALDKAGDHKGAMELRKELGLKKGMGFGGERGGPRAGHDKGN